MSIAQGTIHYDYPQVQLSDRPTFADFNPAFNDIDAKLYSLITDSSTMDTRVDTLESSMDTAQSDIGGLRTDVDLANAGVATNAEAITALQSTVGSHTATLKTKLDSVAIADAYDSEHGTYSVGDIVTYNGQRYKCITAVTAAEPFDADKWQGEDVQTVLDAINSDLANQVLIEVLGNGTKTWKTILNELAAAINNLSISGTAICRQIAIERYDSSTDEVTRYIISDALESSTNPNTYNMRGSSVIGLTGSGAQITAIVLDNTASMRKSIIIDGTGNITVSDTSDTVFPSGASLKAVRKIK